MAYNLAMLFTFPQTQIKFDIPDDWWNDAGMAGFRPSARSYAFQETSSWPLLVVPLSDVNPPTRSPGVRWFCQRRMERILRGFVAGDLIPPITVHEPPGAAIRYAVRGGFHRFYASVAAGFECLPVEVKPYFDLYA